MAIDANSGQVLHEQGADEPRYPASLTKMMTIYIVFEMLEQGRLQPHQRIKITANAAATAPSKLGLEAGAEITVMTAVQALIVKSANDIAVAVGEHIAGSEAKFAALMTQKARQLGMTRTTFRNAHGLPDAAQVTTARDMLTLAMRLSDDFPGQFHLFSLRTFAHGGIVHRNHNTMLTTYRGMDGLKTGYTGPSGFNLVASVRRDGKHVVAAVFGGSSAAARNAYMRVMLDRTIPKASTTKTRQPALVARSRKGEAVAVRTDQPQLVEPIRLAQSPRLAAPPSAPVPKRAAATPAAAPSPAPRQTLQPIPLAPAVPDLPPPVAATPGAPVEVARVRPVVVAPRPQRSVEPASAAPPSPIAEPPAAPRAVPATAAAEPAARGAPPSSLQAQAERMKRGEPPTVATAPGRPAPTAVASATPPTFRLQGPGPATQPTPTNAVMIQIGAYSSEAEAVRQLQAAQSKAASALGTAKPLAVPASIGGRQLYRARFSGFDPATAAAACLELRRQQIDCHVTNGG